MYKFIEKNKVWVVYVPLIVYWIVLLVLTTIPGDDFPDIEISDKIEHFMGYGVLAVFMCLTYMVQTKFKFFSSHPFITTLLVIAFYGVLDETHQIFIPGRTCDVKDWLADMSGTIAGISFVFFITRIKFGQGGSE